MPTLLHIDSSPLGEASISRHLSAEFVQNWKKANPDGKVITRDLTTSSLQPIDAPWIAAIFTPEESLTDQQKQLLSVSDALIAELQQADEIVIGVPMHNFSIPSTLKLWLDLVVRRGKTFSYASGSPEGLVKGKKATFLIASGGVYDAGTAMESFNFTEPYLRTIFGFIGITETSFINAGGASALNYGKVDRATFLQPHIEAVRARF